jgi:hypothetical protein
MKKIVSAALAALVATVALTTIARADDRYGDDDNQWRHHGWHDNDHRNDWRDNDRRDDWRSENRRDDWRRDHWHHDDWDHHAWRGRPWNGPRFGVYWGYDAPVCFIKKHRYVDGWDRVHIVFERVCR